jgi:alpha-ketoglutarate-dependent taurine dioxygenase
MTVVVSLREKAPAALTVTPLEPTIGAEISGIDLTQPLSPHHRDEIKAAILKYKVVFFRDQPITHAQHVDFARQFGPLYPHPTADGVEGYPEIHRITRGKDIQKSAGRTYRGPAIFHTDTSWRLVPAWGAVLHGVVIPDIGGDTIWVDAEAAYANLSDDLKAKLERLFVTHDFRDALIKAGKNYPIVAHPVVRTHPETGARILWVNFGMKPILLGLERAESEDLLNTLWNEYARPEYQVRFKWRTDSIAFWDNRAAVHYAIGDYGEFPRVVERVLIADQAAYADY